MSDSEIRLPLSEAKSRAETLLAALLPYCVKAAIVGSVRRERRIVGDLEILALPRWEMRPDPRDLFGAEIPTNLLHEACGGWGLTWSRPLDPAGLLWKGVYPDGFKAEIYIARTEPAQNWGLLELIRTGPWNYSKRFVSQAPWGGMLPGWLSRDGMLYAHSALVSVPDEATLYELLDLPFVEPCDRDAAAGQDDWRTG